MKSIAGFFLNTLLLFHFVSNAQQGTLDNSFANAGRLIRNIGIKESIIAAAFQQPDGKIVVAGSAYFQSNNLDFYIARFNANGTPDNTFDIDGIVYTDVSSGSKDSLYDAILLSTGKILLASSDPQPVLVRYNSNGSLDNTFDGDGKLFLSGINCLRISSILEQPDGKILIGGSSCLAFGPFDFTVIRLSFQGLFDNTFDGDGIAVIDISPGVYLASAMALQPADNKIVITGVDVDYTMWPQFVTARFNTDGSVDNTFGISGSVITDPSEEFIKTVTDIAVQSNGSILISGYGFDDASYLYSFSLVVKYNSNGTLDNSFDGDGILQTYKTYDFISNGKIVSLADNKIILSGQYKSSSGFQGLALCRINSNATIDNTFGNNGIVQTPVVSGNIQVESGIVLLSDGKLLQPSFLSDGIHLKPSLYRMLGTGAADNSFDNDGFVSINIPNIPGSENGVGLAVRNDDVFITAGTYSNGIIASGSGFISRFTANGTPDASFGINGNILVQSDRYVSIGSAVFQNDGKLLVTGSFYDVWDGHYVFVMRYNENGTPDNTFGTNGRVIITFNNDANNAGLDLALQTDGKIVFTVISDFHNSANNFYYLYRLNTNGSIDNTFGTSGRIQLNFILEDYGDFNPNKQIVFQPDNKILVLGRTTDFSFAVRRFTSNGAIDNSFNGGALLTGRFQGHASDGRSIALQSDGKFIITGVANVGGIFKIGVSRFLSDGSYDNSFNGNGVPIISGISVQQYPASVMVQSDNKIIIGGINDNIVSKNMLAVKLNDNGSLDNSFGTSGYNSIPAFVNYDWVSSMAIQSTGRILLCGSASNGTVWSQAVYRLNNSITTSTSNTIRELKNIIVAPNPVRSKLNISSTNITPGKYAVTVRTIDGKQLFSETITTNGNTLQYSCSSVNWPAGILLVEIKGQDQRKTFRILKTSN